MAAIGTTVGQFAAKDLDNPPTLYYTLTPESVRLFSFVSHETADISSTICDQSKIKDAQ